MTATIDIRLFAGLQHYNPPSPASHPIREGTTIRALLRELDIPDDKAKLLFVNGVKSDLDSKLRNGDRVGIFPPVGGG
jgi:molybdopterin converting factor small subunit